MSEMLRTTRDRTEELSFDMPDEFAVSTLLETGIVVVKNQVPQGDLDSMKRALQLNRVARLPWRLAARGLSVMPPEHRSEYHSLLLPRITQFNPLHTPVHSRLAGSAIRRMVAAHRSLFEDQRLQQRYAGRSVQLNNANLSINLPGAEAFVPHQDSVGLTGVGLVTQTQPTRWHVHAWEGSRAEEDYEFTVEPGDIEVLLERSGAAPVSVSPLSGEVGTNWVSDGSEVHSGVNIGHEMRYRLALFSQETAE